jgi:hypothetical protein
LAGGETDNEQGRYWHRNTTKEGTFAIDAQPHDIQIRMRYLIRKELNSKMKYLVPLLGLVLISTSVISAQEVYTNPNIEYSLELPSSNWRVISEPDAVHDHLEFVNGDRLDGYLQIRRESVDASTTPSQLARRDMDQKLRFLPGFVEGKEEKFSGRLNGVTVSYEFVKTGKPMMGRIYYLQADNRTIYALRFSGLRDKLARIRNQTDLIARSFKIK